TQPRQSVTLSGTLSGNVLTFPSSENGTVQGHELLSRFGSNRPCIQGLSHRAREHARREWLGEELEPWLRYVGIRYPVVGVNRHIQDPCLGPLRGQVVREFRSTEAGHQ